MIGAAEAWNIWMANAEGITPLLIMALYVEMRLNVPRIADKIGAEYKSVVPVRLPGWLQ